MAEQGGRCTRKRLEAEEMQRLAPYASRSSESRGRERPERESALRTAYQRDRHRVVHANSFRRLRGKTQVFIAPAGDHYATRLSHVLEVAQVARDAARALALNEDLAEAIALAHDLGHAPFGHAGQEALDQVLGGGYRHDEQSLRVVRYLEDDGRGLNLTREVLDGIGAHRKPRHSLAGLAAAAPLTLEAEVVRLSDAVAYINHDVDDALRASIISATELPAAATSMLGKTHRDRIDAAIASMVSASEGRPEVRLEPEVLRALDELRDFLFERVYTNPAVTREAERARRVVTELFHYFCQHPEAMPAEYQDDPRAEGVERRVADYIAGMTDSYAIYLFQALFVPKMWPA